MNDVDKWTPRLKAHTQMSVCGLRHYGTDLLAKHRYWPVFSMMIAISLSENEFMLTRGCLSVVSHYVSSITHGIEYQKVVHI